MPYDKEIIVVHDGALDGTWSSTRRRPLVAASGFFFREKNAGKGAVVRSGIKIARGYSIIIWEQGNGKKRVPGRAICTSKRLIALAVAQHPVGKHPVGTAQPTKAHEGRRIGIK